MNKQIVLKFVKGFLTGGLSAVVTALSVGVKVQTLADIKGVLIVLATAFVSGVIHALVEMLKPTVPATVSSVVTTVTPIVPAT